MADYVGSAFKNKEEIKDIISFLSLNKQDFMKYIQVDFKNKIVYCFKDEIIFDEMVLNTDDDWEFVLDTNIQRI